MTSKKPSLYHTSFLGLEINVELRWDFTFPNKLKQPFCRALSGWRVEGCEFEEQLSLHKILCQNKQDQDPKQNKSLKTE